MKISARRMVVMVAVLPLILGAVAFSGNIPITTTSNDALVQYQKGVDLTLKLRTDEAMQYLNRAVMLDPNFAMAYYFIAVNSTTPRERTTNVNKAVSLIDRISDGERMLITAMQQETAGDNIGAERTLRTLTTTYPDDKLAHLTLGEELLQTRNFTDCISELNRVVTIDPTMAAAHNLLGYANIRLGHYDAAETAFRQYITLLSDEPNPYDSYAELLMKEGKFDESITQYEKALRISPTFYSSMLGMASDYTLKGMPVEARKNLQKLYGSTDDIGWQIEALTGIAATYNSEGRYDKAVDELTRARDIALRNNDAVEAARANSLIGTTLLVASNIDNTKGTFLKTRTPEVEKVDEAASYFNNASKVVTNSTITTMLKDKLTTTIMVNQAEVALKKNDITLAKQTIQKIQTQPDVTTDPDLIGQIHGIQGQLAMAERRFDDAIVELNQANLRNPLNLYHLAEAYDGNGNTTRAREIRDQVWNFNENSFELWLVRPIVKP